MKSALLFLVSFLTLTISLFCQAPSTKWAKIYTTIFTGDSVHYNQGNSVQQTIDSGYIITGYTRTSYDSSDVYLMKTNQSGIRLWSKKFNENNGVGNSVTKTSDNGYVFVGSIVRASDGMTDLLLFKTNNIGEVVWRKVYGLSNQRDVGFEVRQTADSGLIISGNTFSNTSNRSGIWLIKTDGNGDSLWTNTYCGIYNSEEYASVQQTKDGGYIIVGSLNITGGSDICLIKTNENGDALWTKTFGGEWHDYGRSVQQSIDGGFILVGYDEVGDYHPNILLIKTNEFGDTLWTKTFDIGDDDFGNSVIQTIDKGFLICGYTYSNSTYDFDDILIKTDENGIVKWTKTIGTPQFDEIANSVSQTFDNGFIITGARKSINSYTWLVKLDSEEIMNIEEPLIELKEFSLSQNYPNPFNPSTKISWQSPVSCWQTLKVFDVLGREVTTIVDEYKQAGSYKVEFNASNLASGIYFYQLKAGVFIETNKMVLMK